MRLDDAGHQERVPPVGSDSPPAPNDRFRSAPSGRAALGFLRRSLMHTQHRRKIYRARRLRVCVDGEERWQCDPEGGVYGPFEAPLSASYLDVFGDDAEGALLLAVFPLPAPGVVADERAQHLCVSLEGGQTVTLDVALGDRRYGEVRGYVMHLTYAESAAVDTRGSGLP
jgi:hypothetical protein